MNCHELKLEVYTQFHFLPEQGCQPTERSEDISLKWETFHLYGWLACKWYLPSHPLKIKDLWNLPEMYLSDKALTQVKLLVFFLDDSKIWLNLVAYLLLFRHNGKLIETNLVKTVYRKEALDVLTGPSRKCVEVIYFFVPDCGPQHLALTKKINIHPFINQD